MSKKNEDFISEKENRASIKEILKGVMMILQGLGGLLIVIIFIAVITGKFDDSFAELVDGTSAVKSGKDTKSSTDETENSKQSSTSDDGYYHVGDTVKIGNDGGESAEITVIEMGVATNAFGGEATVYVTADVMNTSESEITIDCWEHDVYIDGYQYASSEQITVNGDDNFYVSINPGRKVKALFRVPLPVEYLEADTVELDIYGTVFLFMENGEWVYDGVPTFEDKQAHAEEITGVRCGSYTNPATGATFTVFYNENNTFAASLSGAGAEYDFEYGGISEDLSRGAFDVCPDLGVHYYLRFVDGGVNVEMSSLEENPIAGYYQEAGGSDAGDTVIDSDKSDADDTAIDFVGSDAGDTLIDSGEEVSVLPYVPEEVYFPVGDGGIGDTHVWFWYDTPNDGKEKATFTINGNVLFDTEPVNEAGDGSYVVNTSDGNDFKFTFYNDGTLFVYSDSFPDVIGWYECY